MVAGRRVFVWMAVASIGWGLGASCSQEDASRSKRSGTGNDGVDADDGTVDGGSGSDLTYYNFAKEVLDERCIECHDGSPTAGGGTDFTLTSYDESGGLAGAFAKAERIKARVPVGRGMPPTGSHELTADQRSGLIEWVDAGAPRGVPPAEVPVVTVGSPETALTATPPSKFHIEVVFQNLPDEATWQAYYAEAPELGAGVLIAESAGLTVTQTTIDWDVAAVPAGTYYIVVEASVGGAVVASDVSQGTVQVIPNSAPTAALSGNWKSGGFATTLPADVAFSGSDSDGEIVRVTLDYSLDSGTTWTNVVTDSLISNGTVEWASGPSGYNIKARLRLTVKDSEGNVAVDESASDFGITDMDINWTNSINTLLTTNCATSCHADDSNTEAIGALDVRDFAGSVKPNAAAIIAAVLSDRMPEANPPPNIPLSATDKARLQIWYWQGAN